MRRVDDIKEYQDELRETILTTSRLNQREILREQVFTLDKVLGLFNDGKPLTQIQVFELLQNAQRIKVNNPDNPTNPDEIKTVGAIKAYQWVMS